MPANKTQTETMHVSDSQKVYEEGNAFSTFVRYLLELLDGETG